MKNYFQKTNIYPISLCLGCFLFLAINFQCKKDEKKNTSAQTTQSQIPTQPKIPYSEFLKEINKKSKAEKQKDFFKFINYDVPNYWIGTAWSFNGTTRQPQKESIACGYFVTNTLTDYGFDFNRIYLAQQASSVMIKKLCKDIQYFSKREDLEKYLLSKDKNQVYIVGLDFHTGFITRENKDTYFINSSYIKNRGVVKETTAESPDLNSSKSFMIGRLEY